MTAHAKQVATSHSGWVGSTTIDRACYGYQVVGRAPGIADHTVARTLTYEAAEAASQAFLDGLPDPEADR